MKDNFFKSIHRKIETIMFHKKMNVVEAGFTSGFLSNNEFGLKTMVLLGYKCASLPAGTRKCLDPVLHSSLKIPVKSIKSVLFC